MPDLRELFENGITREGLRKIFNPYTIMTNADSDFFSQDVFYALERKTPFEELKILPFYTTYIEKDKEYSFENAIKTFLSYKDNMPFYPTVEDWMKEISAPEDFIKKIIPENGVSLSTIFCSYESELQTIFWKKIENMEKIERDNFDEGKFEFSDTYFYDYFTDRVSSSVKTQWKKYLSKEFEVAKRLQEAYDNEEYYRKIAKEKNLSINDTVMLFIDYAFENYDELIRELFCPK